MVVINKMEGDGELKAGTEWKMQLVWEEEERDREKRIWYINSGWSTAAAI